MIRRPPPAAHAALLAAALLPALAGCGKQTMVAGLMLGMPHVDDPTGQVPGGIGPYNLLTGAVFTIDTSDPTKIQDAKIEGVDKVAATVVYRSCIPVADATQFAACRADGSFGADRAFPLSETTAGIYTLFSGDQPKDAQLTFEYADKGLPGARYTLVMEVPLDGTKFDAGGKPIDTEAYGASFRPGPPAHMKEFANKAAVKHTGPGQGFRVNRDDAKVDGQFLPAFVLVGKVDPQNATAQPQITWNSISGNTWPPDPKKLLLLALSDQPYRVDHFDIDGSAFSSPGYFVVAMLSIAEGKASANAFIGSTALSGSGDLGLVQVP